MLRCRIFFISAHLRSLLRIAIHHHHFSRGSLPSCVHSLGPLILRTSSPHTQRRLRRSIRECRRSISEACSLVARAAPECFSLWNECWKFLHHWTQTAQAFLDCDSLQQEFWTYCFLPTGCSILQNLHFVFLQSRLATRRVCRNRKRQNGTKTWSDSSLLENNSSMFKRYQSLFSPHRYHPLLKDKFE